MSALRFDLSGGIARLFIAGGCTPSIPMPNAPDLLGDTAHLFFLGLGVSSDIWTRAMRQIGP